MTRLERWAIIAALAWSGVAFVLLVIVIGVAAVHVDQRQPAGPPGTSEPGGPAPDDPTWDPNWVPDMPWNDETKEKQS